MRFTCTMIALASLASAGSETTPKGLSSSDWTAIQAAYEHDRYSAKPEPGGYQAGNAAQQWTTHFDGRGFTVKPGTATWTWGLELSRYGLAGSERVPAGARVTSRQNRIRYERGALEEWFLNDGRGLEQGFTLQQRPSGEVPCTLTSLSAAGSGRRSRAIRSASWTREDPRCCNMAG